MERHFENKITLSWSHKGSFQATIVNGIITELAFCEPGNGPENCGKCLNSVDIKFLQDVHNSLGELFKQVEEAHKDLGYSYAKEEVEDDPKL